MKYGSLIYRNNINLGDQIQSIAVEQFLPRVDRFFDRDTLALEKVSDPHLLIMQGWFSMTPEKCFPPSGKIVPIFFGLHLSDFNNGYHHFFSGKSLEYFKIHEPIGCRDKNTAELLNKNGIAAYLSHCITLTFPERDKPPGNGKVILVDVDKAVIPEALKKGAITISHKLSDSAISESEKRDMARALLNLYHDHARLVVTSRLHCALPCVAMGIPVVYFGRGNDSRLSVLQEIGIQVNSFSAIPEVINWEPETIKIDPIKSWMNEEIKSLIRKKICSH
jgi:hypothetical protein